MADEEIFTKIVIDLPDAEDGISGEGVWSVKVGPDLYEVRNSPWHTTEINYLDIVRAVEPSPDKNPVVTDVYRRSGHRTIHLVFLREDVQEHKEVLGKLNILGATYEGATQKFYAIDLPPECSFDNVTDFLQAKQDSGLLEQRYASQPQPPTLKLKSR